MNPAARISELETQLRAITSERDDLAHANLRCEERYHADQLTITALTTERDTARRELTAEREGREPAISREVLTRLASAGIDPIKRDPNATVDAHGNGKPTGSAKERLAAHINARFQQ